MSVVLTRTLRNSVTCDGSTRGVVGVSLEVAMATASWGGAGMLWLLNVAGLLDLVVLATEAGDGDCIDEALMVVTGE
jgi:hypothetical protein